MGIFNIFKFFKKNKEIAEIAALQQSVSIKMQDNELNNLRIELDEVKRDMSILKEAPLDNDSLNRINDKFTEILKNFMIVKDISETLVPAVGNQRESIEILIAQQEALSTLYILLTDVLISANIISEEDMRPPDLN